jgi:hypothetical protein
MTTANNNIQMVANWMRWIARTISTLAALAWLLIFLDIVACEALFGSICINWEMALLAGMVIVSLASVLVAWRWELIGGLVMFIWGLVFAAIAYVTSRPYQAISVLVTGIPFLIAGSLFMASWWLDQAINSNEPLSIAE